MNWYKKAQLKETLPYFQEFEEYGDYVPQEDTLNEKLNSMGLSLGDEINRGDSGIAYTLSNGDVLKITTNSQEGQIAEMLVQNPHPSIANYKTVWKEGDLYYIVMEHLDKMISDDQTLNDIFNKLEDIINHEGCYDPSCALDILKNNKYFNSLNPPVKNSIANYLSHLLSAPFSPFSMFDFLNPANIGIKNGEIKFFDIT